MSSESLTMVLHLSHEMLRLAQQQEWEVLAEYEARRSQLLEFSPLSQSEDGAAYAAAMQEVIDLDKQVIALCRKAQDETAAALHAIAAGRRIDAAYTKHM